MTFQRYLPGVVARRDPVGRLRGGTRHRRVSVHASISIVATAWATGPIGPYPTGHVPWRWAGQAVATAAARSVNQRTAAPGFVDPGAQATTQRIRPRSTQPQASFQRTTTGSPCSQPRTETVAVDRANNPPSSGGRPSQRAARTRRRWPWAKARTSPSPPSARTDGVDAVDPGRDVGSRLAAGYRASPDRPARILLADLRGGQALEIPVVPFEEIGCPFVHTIRESGEASGVESARQGRGEDLGEGRDGELCGDGPSLRTAALGERDVRAPGVPTEARPVGLTMADEQRSAEFVDPPSRRA